MTGKMMPETNWAPKLALYRASLRSSKRSSMSASRPKTRTRSWPEKDSSIWPFSDAGVLPLRGEELLAAGADDAGSDAGQREGDQGDQRQLPGDDEHHDHNADDRQQRADQLGERLLQCLLDVVDVVRHPGEDVAALAGVEVVQRQPVQLLLGVVAELADDLHDDPVQHVALQPQEDVGHKVHQQHDGNEDGQLLEVDAAAGHQFHLGDHVREVVLPLLAQSLHELVLAGAGGELLAHHSAEDHVHGLAQDLGGDDVQDHRDHHHGQPRRRCRQLRASAAPSAAWRRARSVRPSWRACRRTCRRRPRRACTPPRRSRRLPGPRALPRILVDVAGPVCGGWAC